MARHANKAAKEKGASRHSVVPKPSGGKHPSSRMAAKLASKSGTKTKPAKKKSAPRRGGLFGIKWSSAPEPEDTGDAPLIEETKVRTTMMDDLLPSLRFVVGF